MLAGGDDDPYVLSFRGIDNETYYMLNPNNKAHLLNYSGCGNTVSANHPAVKQMIMDSCRRQASCPVVAAGSLHFLFGSKPSASNHQYVQ